MPFPASQRIIYNKNPIAEVWCVASYDTNLEILPKTDSLASFQKELKKDFSKYIDHTKEESEKKKQYKGHEFSSDDGIWSVFLTEEFCGLRARSYSRWEEFRGNMALMLSALRGCYGVSQYNELSLRYSDVIVPEQLGVPNEELSKFLAPHIGATIRSGIIKDLSKAGCWSNVSIPYDENSSVDLQHGLVQNPSSKQLGYAIYTTLTVHSNTDGVENALEWLDSLNIVARNCFHWCITDELRERMEPEIS